MVYNHKSFKDGNVLTAAELNTMGYALNTISDSSNSYFKSYIETGCPMPEGGYPVVFEGLYAQGDSGYISCTDGHTINFFDAGASMIEIDAMIPVTNMATDTDSYILMLADDLNGEVLDMAQVVDTTGDGAVLRIHCVIPNLNGAYDFVFWGASFSGSGAWQFNSGFGCPAFFTVRSIV